LLPGIKGEAPGHIMVEGRGRIRGVKNNRTDRARKRSSGRGHLHPLCVEDVLGEHLENSSLANRG